MGDRTETGRKTRDTGSSQTHSSQKRTASQNDKQDWRTSLLTMTSEQRAAHIVDVLTTEFGAAHGPGPGGVPAEVPQDGRLAVRVLPGQRLPVLRRHDRRIRRRPVPRRADQPGVDPRRPARRELRHLHERLRRAGVQRQRLRRGVRRPVLLGPQALRGQRRADRLREGPVRRRDRRAGRPVRRRAYLTELRAIAAGGDDAIGSITLDNADRRAAHGASAGPPQHPRRPAQGADHDRQLRAPVRRSATGSSRSTRSGRATCAPRSSSI